MDKKQKVIGCLDRLYWHLVYQQRAKDAGNLYDIIMGLIRAKNAPALRAWAVKARRVISEIKS